MSYIDAQKQLATAWKLRTDTLPDAARAAALYVSKDGTSRGGPYDFCLPREFAAYNLLPEVRDDALAIFAELRIPWHAGVDGGPSNHLLSSQVQCVNALGQMVKDPQRLRAAFGVADVLAIEPGRYLTFEYVGPTDFFGEAPGGERVRGAHCTSVDAAFLHRLPDGRTELVLVEWKYTESYRKRSPEPDRDRVRRKRYLEAVMDPDGPIDGSLLPFELLLDEPLYQLVRQQLLAHALEKTGVADRVRLVHVLSPLNREYQRSLHRPQQRALGDTVSAVWRRLLQHSDRFSSMDSGTGAGQVRGAFGAVVRSAHFAEGDVLQATGEVVGSTQLAVRDGHAVRDPVAALLDETQLGFENQPPAAEQPLERLTRVGRGTKRLLDPGIPCLGRSSCRRDELGKRPRAGEEPLRELLPLGSRQRLVQVCWAGRPHEKAFRFSGNLSSASSYGTTAR